MSRFQDLLVLKNLLDCDAVGKEVAAVTFVELLDKYDSTYHFDDPAEEIIHLSTREKLFTEEEVPVVNYLVSELYGHDIMGILCKKMEERDEADNKMLERADQAFWQVIANYHPEIKSGDLSPTTTAALHTAQRQAYFEWYKLNKGHK